MLWVWLLLMQELTKSMSMFGYDILQALVNDIAPDAKVSSTASAFAMTPIHQCTCLYIASCTAVLCMQAEELLLAAGGSMQAWISV
jgi:hypothetical protein